MSKENERICVELNEKEVQEIIDCYEKDIKYIKQLEHRIDKAIEYIKEHSTTIDYKTMKADYNLNMNDLLEILKGGNNDK